MFLNKRTGYIESSKIPLSIAAVAVLLFIEGVTVRTNGKQLISWNNETYGLIDSFGKEIAPVKYNHIYYVGHGVYWLREKSTDGSEQPILLNRTGTFIATKVPEGTRFDRVLWLGASAEANEHLVPEMLANDALLVYRDKRNCGVCDKDGRVVLPPVYERVGYVNENLVVLRNLDKKLFILNVKTRKCQSISDEVVDNGIDITFYEGLARFKNGDVYGFIDSSGNVVIKPKRGYEWLSYGFTDGLACLNIQGTNGKTLTGAVANKAGKVVSPPNMSIAEFWGDFAVAKLAGKVGVVNRQFKFVIKPDYDVLLAQSVPYYTVDDIFARRHKPPLFYYALKNKGEPPVVLSTDGNVLFNLPKEMAFPNWPPHVHDGVIDCPVWTTPNTSKSVYLDMKGNQVADPLSKLPKMPFVRYQEIAPGFLLKAVSPKDQPSARTY